MQMTYSIGNGQTTIAFDAKPSANVRSMLKANRFRWSPASQYWWRRGATGAADVIAAVQTTLDREAGIRRPDGACWKCKAPEGFLRNRGAAAPVYCDACNRADLEHSQQIDDFDMRYEDDCARRCGL